MHNIVAQEGHPRSARVHVNQPNLVGERQTRTDKAQVYCYTSEGPGRQCPHTLLILNFRSAVEFGLQRVFPYEKLVLTCHSPAVPQGTQDVRDP